MRIDYCYWLHFKSWIASILMQRAGVGDHAGQCRSGSGKWGCQKRPSAWSLATFKITVACADGILARGKPIAVHGDTHRAARLAPFRTCVGKYPVQAFGFRLSLDGLRAWHDQNSDAICDAPTRHDKRRLP
jgi:hypothetical protein